MQCCSDLFQDTSRIQAARRHPPPPARKPADLNAVGSNQEVSKDPLKLLDQTNQTKQCQADPEHRAKHRQQCYIGNQDPRWPALPG